METSGLTKQRTPPPGEEEDTLRRTVRRSLKELRAPALTALLRVIRYAEEGKTPMAVAAEDLAVPYKFEAIFREAERLRSGSGKEHHR